MIAELRNRIKTRMFSLCSLSCKERQVRTAVQKFATEVAG